MIVTLNAGPLVKFSGMVPLRIVLRAVLDDNNQPKEYIVHTQGFYPGQGPSYNHGNYFPVHAFGQEAYQTAKRRFEERCREKYHGVTPDQELHPDCLEILGRFRLLAS